MAFNLPKARETFLEALALGVKHGELDMVSAYVNMACVSRRMEDYDQCLEYCQLGEALLIEIGGRVPDVQKGQAMTRFCLHKSSSFRVTGRLDEALKVALEAKDSAEIYFGKKGDGEYSGILLLLFEICKDQKDYVGAVAYLEEYAPYFARSPVYVDILKVLAELLSDELHDFQKAVIVREKHLAACRQIAGPQSNKYAIAMCDAGTLYFMLKQLQRAKNLFLQAEPILAQTCGKSHFRTRAAQNTLEIIESVFLNPDSSSTLGIGHLKTLDDQNPVQQFTDDRLCSIAGCNTVESKMKRCITCRLFYVCKNHTKKIHEHAPLCLRIPDGGLPDEKKGGKITKCRRCRKEGKLMKCSACGGVCYCGGACQNADWARHKQFCGK